MPHIIYNGISLSPVGDFDLTYEPVYDDSKLDLLYNNAHITGTFIVNGQVELRTLDDPPTSYIDSGIPSDRVVEAVANRPPGFPAPGVPNDHPFNTEGPERQKGAINDEAALFAFTYKAPLNSPSYAAEKRKAAKLIAGAAPVPTTLRNIIDRLTDPRGQLFVYEGTGLPDEIIIHSPEFDRHSDAAGGPHPTVLDIQRTQGDGVTFFVTWACVTALNMHKRTSPTDPILSNRWRMTHNVRYGGFTDVTVEGTAVFDLGLLHKGGFDADSFRAKLMLPIPKGYVRSDIDWTELESGDALHYRYTDHQQQVNFPGGVYVYATDVHGEHEQWVICEDDFGGNFIGTIDSIINRRWMMKSIKEDGAPAGKPMAPAGSPPHP